MFYIYGFKGDKRKGENITGNKGKSYEGGQGTQLCSQSGCTLLKK